MSKKSTILALSAIGVVIIGSYVSLSFHNRNTQTDIITIGAPLSLTGSAATDGLNIKRGIDLAVDVLSKQGIYVNVVYEDDGTEAKRTVSAVQKIISTNKPEAIIGPTWGILVDSIKNIVDDARVVSYSPANTSEFVNSKGDYLFFGATINARKEGPLAEWLKQNNKKKVAIIIDKSTWGESNALAFEKAVKDSGGDVVYREEIPFGAEASTLPTSLAKLNSVGADVILATGYEEGLTLLINKVKQLDSKIPVVIASQIPKTLLARGVIHLDDQYEVDIVTTKASEEFASKFYAKYGEAPGTYADRAYDGLMLLVEAIRNKSKKETLKDYLHNKTNYAGYATTYKFDENGDVVGGDWVIEKLK